MTIDLQLIEDEVHIREHRKDEEERQLIESDKGNSIVENQVIQIEIQE